jgi:hypothetical protein
MKNALFPIGLLVLVLCGCGSGQKEELQGRPLVLQLGMKISTASNTQTLDEVQAKITTTKLGPKVQQHLTNALEAQRKLLTAAAEMQMNERMDGAKKVVSEIEAASAAVE